MSLQETVSTRPSRHPPPRSLRGRAGEGGVPSQLREGGARRSGSE
jgi:hypothetical protein